MKKSLVITFLVTALLALSFSLVMAKTEKVNLEGEITAVDEATPTITVTTADSEDFTIYFSPEYDFTFTQADIGSFVHVKAEYQEDGTLLALWVKPVDESEEDDDDKAESAYCSGEKETAHPAIIVLASRFEKEVDDLMGYFCEGFGVGQIYLALQTEKVTGEDYESLLALRKDGQGWGEIWKDLDHNGKPKDDDKTPPGQDKDKDKDKDQDKDKDKDKDDDPQVKDKEKDKEKTKEKKPKKEK